jgi:hypothetical protein
MSEAPGNARLEEFLREQIPRLAILYDRFAYALDPFDQGRDIAEQTFNSELATWFDALPEPRPTFREFRRHVISLSASAICAQATDRLRSRTIHHAHRKRLTMHSGRSSGERTRLACSFRRLRRKL